MEWETGFEHCSNGRKIQVSVVFGGFHSHGGIQKWLVYTGRSQSNMDENWGYPHDFGNLHVVQNPVGWWLVRGSLPNIFGIRVIQSGNLYQQTSIWNDRGVWTLLICVKDLHMSAKVIYRANSHIEWYTVLYYRYIPLLSMFVSDGESFHLFSSFRQTIKPKI